MCLIDQYIPEIKELCMAYNVQKLSAFGSVLTDRFTEQSDVDLLVTFDKNLVGDYFTNFFDFKYALEGVKGCRSCRGAIHLQSLLQG